MYELPGLLSQSGGMFFFRFIRLLLAADGKKQGMDFAEGVSMPD